ncbi:DNA-directed RNA polymerase subunit beta [Striga asiatica]|uniref:DNA-directed RNA polymerase subunit beta n=1 Tax=Striga asiatica TaxID=4170 RepID=A0A5A7PQD3_STRAF|nr:DNA-directed RNA polymerase subunit beta [Striga asiatica]
MKNFPPKGKVLTRAMFGVKVLTLFVCSIFVAAFSGSGEKLIDLRVVPEVCSWAEAVFDLQNFVNAEIRKEFAVLREVENVYSVVNKLYLVVQDGVREESEKNLIKVVSDLEDKGEKLYLGLNELAKEVDDT